ncbi:MAG: ATP-binding cassette domain-containing protein, partial [Pseudoflavonifractor sp.]
QTVNTAETTEQALSRAMIGRELNAQPVRRIHHADAQETLCVQDLQLAAGRGNPKLQDISFSLHEGEILGVAGVDGNGQKDLAEVLARIQKQTGGTISYCGEAISTLGIRACNRKGIAYIPDDRHKDGLDIAVTVQDNLMLRQYPIAPFSTHGILNFKQISDKVASEIEAYNIKTPGAGALVRYLSGGNQQKIILARELNERPKLIIACQPTRGLDIGASEYVHDRLLQCCKDGGSVLLISTDLEEILLLSDRIAVMYGGKIMGILENNAALDVETIGLLMGGKRINEVCI